MELSTVSSCILTLHREFAAYTTQRLQELGLSFGLIYFVIYVGKHPDCTPSELTKDLHLDFATDIEHIASDCTSYQLFKGLAADGGTSVFSGRIYVAQDAQRTQAFQQNNNLLLSDGAHVYAKPQLEIYADNVKCSHGATVGQLDPEAIYYMRQRGIGLEDARRLQMYGFVLDVLGESRVQEMNELFDREIASKIEGL